MKTVSLSGKNAAILILIGMWAIFLAAWILFALRGEKDLATELGKLFVGANFALATMINTEIGKKDAPPPPGGTANPTQ